MRIRVLGSAAGGGFPQWNCNCVNCSGVRAKQINALPRTQSSIAISEDNKNWVIINTSPEILQQISAFSDLTPSYPARNSAIASVILTDSQFDHCSGLISLREGKTLDVYSTEAVYQDLTEVFPLFKLLNCYCGIDHHQITTQEGIPFQVKGAESLSFYAIATASKAPPYSPDRNCPREGSTIALFIVNHKTNAKLLYAPNVFKITPHLFNLMQSADLILIDGTFWLENEMQLQGLSQKLAADMGHLPLAGKGGLIEVLNQLEKPRKILIHINNTNPILNEDSTERAVLKGFGIEVAFDGMDITLAGDVTSN